MLSRRFAMLPTGLPAPCCWYVCVFVFMPFHTVATCTLRSVPSRERERVQWSRRVPAFVSGHWILQLFH